MPGPSPFSRKLSNFKLKIPKGMSKREYLKSLNSSEENTDDVPTRLQRKETTVDEVRMAKGGRAGYKHGGAAKRGHGCEIK
jgi:hypothetical protein